MFVCFLNTVLHVFCQSINRKNKSHDNRISAFLPPRKKQHHSCRSPSVNKTPNNNNTHTPNRHVLLCQRRHNHHGQVLVCVHGRQRHSYCFQRSFVPLPRPNHSDRGPRGPRRHQRDVGPRIGAIGGTAAYSRWSTGEEKDRSCRGQRSFVSFEKVQRMFRRSRFCSNSDGVGVLPNKTRGRGYWSNVVPPWANAPRCRRSRFSRWLLFL